MKKSNENQGMAELSPVKIATATFKVRGLTPLIVSRFPEKAKQMILDKQMKKAATVKEAKNPEELYKQSLYQFSDGKRTGFPAVGFKAAMVRAGKQLSINMTDSRGRFHVIAEDNDLVEIQGKLRMREDMVRLATGVADVRFRGEYATGWTSTISITYIENSISVEQLAQLLKIAGFSCGIGEWRPEKSNSGSFGLFEVIQ
jgi:hypothetical protein